MPSWVTVALFACSDPQRAPEPAASLHRDWTASTWSISSGQRLDDFGDAMAAGDLDADGDDDLLIGAPLHDGTGAAMLFLGSPAGPVAVTRWRGLGLELGFAVAIGDLDGDGHPEVILGAPGSDRVYGFERGVGGWPAAPTWTVAPTGPGRFGASLAVADLNGDGLDDLLVGAPQASDPEEEEGVVYVFAGSAGGPTWAAQLGADLAGAHAGDDLAVADQDGDGALDIAVSDGAWTPHATEVVARLYHGVAGGWPSWSSNVGGAGWLQSSFLARVTFADVDPTPGLELVVPHRYSWEGVFYDKLEAFGVGGDWAAGRPFATPGEQQATRSVYADLTGDGVGDLIVADHDWWGSSASAYANGLELPVPGRKSVLLLAGPHRLGLQPNQVPIQAAPPVVLLQDASSFIGETMIAADVDGDGALDLVASRPTADVVQILPGHLIQDAWQTWPTQAPWTVLPGATLVVGDVDGDGLADAVQRDGDTLTAHRGLPTGISPTPSFTWAAPDADHRWGDQAALGDVNGDGHTDIVIAAPGATADVVLLAGAAGGWPQQALRWTASDASFGGALAVGDLDGDGHDDVAIAAPNEVCSGHNRGVIRMYAGSSTPSTAVAQTYGPGACTYRNAGDLAIGDVDADGKDDLIVTASGRVDVLRGTAGLPATVAWQFTLTEPYGTRQPARVEAADVTGDGIADIVATIPDGYTTVCWPAECYQELRDTGWVLTWTGRAGSSPLAAAMRNGDTQNHEAGVSLAVADVTGDRLADVLIGGRHAGYSDRRDLRWIQLLAGQPTGPASPGPWSSPEGMRAAQRDALRAGDLNGDGYADLLVTDELCASMGRPCAAVLWGSPGGPFADPDADVDGDGYVASADCDDGDPSRAIAGPESAFDGIDQDCNGVELCHYDYDGDGFVADVVLSDDGDCADPGESTVLTLTDCYRWDERKFPGAVEIPGDGADGNCDGVELCLPDLDHDGAAEQDWPPVEVPAAQRSCTDPGVVRQAAPADSCFGLGADADADGMCDDVDTCPTLPGEDTDADGVCAADACIGDDALGDANHDGWCDTRLRITATAIDPLQVRVDVRGPPNTPVRVFRSESGVGNGPCHPAWPLCFDLNFPEEVLARRITLDRQGRGTIRWRTDEDEARAPLWVQAAIVAPNGGMSNVAFVRAPAP